MAEGVSGGAAVAVCRCQRRFFGETENDALGRLHRHVMENAEAEEGQHGIWEIGKPDSRGQWQMEALREEIERLLDEREGGNWNVGRELDLTRQMLRYTVMYQHQNLHETDRETWRNCRRVPCMYAQFVLPEVEEVQWIRGGGDR